MNTKTEILSHFYKHPEVNACVDELKLDSNKNVLLKGISGSSLALILSGVLQLSKKSIVCLFPSREDAAYFHSDLLSFLNPAQVIFCPSTYKKKIQICEADSAFMVLRNDAISQIMKISFPSFIIVYPESIVEKVIKPVEMEQQSLMVHKGEKISPKFLEEILFEYQFEYTDMVTHPGQFSRRGSIVDVFSFSSEYPVRIDFFGDEVDSLRYFEIESQLSVSVIEQTRIVPDFQVTCAELVESSLFEFFAEKPLLFINEVSLCMANMQTFYDLEKKGREMYGESRTSSSSLFYTPEEVLPTLKNHQIIEQSTIPYFEKGSEVQFSIVPQLSFNKNFELLAKDMSEKKEEGFGVYLFAENQTQVSRLHSIFQDLGYRNVFTHIPSSIHQGFTDNASLISFYSDHQIFERHQRYKLRDDFVKNESITINEFLSLNPGDYVVHIDHGVGIFGGIEKIELNGKQFEQIRIVFKDNDVLYVNLHNLHKISKYKSGEGTAPKLNKLGSGAWAVLKQKTKSKLKDIARDLIELYARRMQQSGMAYSPDTYMQQELEASFMYDDTPDQEKATKDIKGDMELCIPMDRLVCGDVGFGKTELAIRAAFKAVADNKQVAVLVPTTILAMQHYYTFKERLREFPCVVDQLSRLRSPLSQRMIMQDLKEGKIDIIIGTHKLLNSLVEFKDLGLLIIDEEQKFGVAAKEKLRSIRVNVDTLTLTATPIPRTLQFSLMGARDLSILNTPPPNRQPIVTEVYQFNEDIIRQAIDNELERKGQVFFVHNKVQNMMTIRAKINKICPHARVIIGHGQMKPADLEEALISFIDGSFDILLCTTIVENGLDIPNANTIIINDAQNFGLSDLHQLRGRVGRSNKRAYCFLLTPEIHTLSSDARRRLKAIESFSDLGSGMNIAMQDLDIRGAGNLLGAEQSGFIADIGFEAYRKILNEAMEELKETEYKELFANKEDKKDAVSHYSHEVSFETDLELFIPESYVENVAERIRLYREISSFDNFEQIENFKTKIIDRFGKIPNQALQLLDVGPLKQVARDMGFERIILKNNKLTLYFISNQDSSFYQSSLFQQIMDWILSKRNQVNLKENKDKLSLIVENMKSLQDITLLFDEIKMYSKI